MKCPSAKKLSEGAIIADENGEVLGVISKIIRNGLIEVTPFEIYFPIINGLINPIYQQNRTNFGIGVEIVDLTHLEKVSAGCNKLNNINPEDTLLGVKIAQVTPSSPAEIIGIKRNDIILGINTPINWRPITNARDFFNIIPYYFTTITNFELYVLRDGQLTIISVVQENNNQ